MSFGAISKPAVKALSYGAKKAGAWMNTGEVGLIAHSCGVRSPRELSRRHARIVQENGTSVMLADIYPDICAANIKQKEPG